MKRPLDDSTAEKKHKCASGAEESKRQSWTAEEDRYLIEEAKKMESKNWRVTCKRMNKVFKNCRRTSKECEQRWKELNSELTLSEELLILLSFYRGTLGTASDILDVKVNLNDYIEKLVEKACQTAAKHESVLGCTPLQRLQFLVCTNLALSADKSRNEPFQKHTVTEGDWLSLSQSLIGPREKLTAENLHKYTEAVVSRIEERVYSLTDTDDEFMGIMHERKDNPSQGRISQPQICLVPFMAGNQPYYVLSSYYQQQPPPNNC